MIRIVVVDDHPIVRAGLCSVLDTQPDMSVVAEAADGPAALAEVARCRPDVVVMDLRMPGMDGVAATRELVSRHSGLRVLILTTFDDVTTLLRAVEAGAAGCLLKDVGRDELFRAVRSVAAGQPVLTPRLVAGLQERNLHPAPSPPSERELEVLGLVAQGRTNQAIARSLSISTATVKTHLVHVFAKLGVADRTGAVRVALERGLLTLDRER